MTYKYKLEISVDEVDGETPENLSGIISHAILDKIPTVIRDKDDVVIFLCGASIEDDKS